MIREEINEKQWQFPFIIYRPKNSDKKLPMILYLHGAGELGTGGDELAKIDNLGFSHILKKKDYPCILVEPQCAPDSFWVAEIPKLFDFISAVKEKYNVDENRISLTGVSMGGYGAWYLALRHPQIFSAIAPISGGGMMWKSGVLDMPIWTFIGSDDDIVYPSETMNIIHHIRSSKTNDCEVKMTVYDNVGHEAHEYAYNEELLEWLLSKSR